MAKKMCTACHVPFVNPCPMRVMHESRGAAYPRDICPSCYLARIHISNVILAEEEAGEVTNPSTGAVTDFYVAVSHCVNNIKLCEKCPNYMKCMTLAVNR